MKRRDFLKLAGAAGIAFSTPIPLMGQTAPEDVEYTGPLFAVFNAGGGWDPTYLTDPKGNGLNNGYGPGDILTEAGIRYAPTTPAAGMSNQAFFSKYGQELLVVNGVDMSINNHAPNSRYIATGRQNSFEYPTFAALSAAALAPEVPLAFLTFGNYSSTANLVASTRISEVSRLAGLGDVNAGRLNRAAESRIESALQDVVDAGHSLPKLRRVNSTIFGAQQSSKALSRVVPFLPTGDLPYGTGIDQVEIALAAFASGLGVSANLSQNGFLGGKFDSHEDNDGDQLPSIAGLLAMIDHMLERAEEMGLRDRLYIIMQSEMGRSAYNGSNGKDHWSVTSKMYMGPGIVGGRTIGATDDEQYALTINPQTLQVDAGGIRIRPEHLTDMIRDLAGVRESGIAGQFPLDVPDDERLLGLWG